MKCSFLFLISSNEQQSMPTNNSSSSSHLKCQFCDHVSKDSYLAIEHTLYHLNTKVNVPKNFLFENQIRNMLSNTYNYQMPPNFLPPTLSTIPCLPTVTFPTKQNSHLQQTGSTTSSSNSSKSLMKAQQHQVKYGSNTNRSSSSNNSELIGAEYIDISEYEKFFAVLQEAAGE